ILIFEMAEEKTIVKHYTKGDLKVRWEPGKCIHSKKCWKGLLEVFDPRRKPWVDLEAADNDKIMAQIDQCPSAALSYEKANSKSDDANQTKVTLIDNGPALIEGTLELNMPDGQKWTTSKVALCRCGKSGKNPYCDGSHNKD
ncbi:MAG: (4Fe-4S)-binding protein, partial [Flavobacteriales bacterium]|nr:(4Fe-4S)-binding protein [Flavobacteriales bacterium]